MKDKIIKILQNHPRGLKAKEIASYIPNTDRRMINQILYTNKDCFQVSDDYVWTLKNKKTNIPKASKEKETTSPFQYLSERDIEILKERWRQKEAREKQWEQERLQREKEAEARRSKGDGFALFRKCTSDCSTCTRDECIEK